MWERSIPEDTGYLFKFYYVSESAEDAPKAYPSPDPIGYADP